MMRSSFLELPDECICTILSFLRPSQVKRVALTFNRRLLAIANPFLEPLTKIKKDEAYFESLFGKVNPENYRENKEGLEKLGFTHLPISVPARLSHHLEYLDLKDDLSWFEDIVEEYDLAADNANVVNLDDDNVLEKLIESSARLGLTLPPSFITLLRSKNLLDKLPTCCAWYIELSPLHKIRKQLEDDPTRNEEGYIFTWFSDQQGCGYKNMYLDTAGRHAVLGADLGPVMSKEENEGVKEDWLDLTDIEKREGIVAIDSGMVGDNMLEDVNFERWLVNHYYSERVFFLERPKEENGESTPIIPEHMRKHFYNVYTEEGRKMQ